MKEAAKHFHNIFQGIVKRCKKLLDHFILLNLEVLNSLYRTYPNAASTASSVNVTIISEILGNVLEETEISGNIIGY